MSIGACTVASLFLPSLCISRELGTYERHNDLADPGTQNVAGPPAWLVAVPPQEPCPFSHLLGCLLNPLLGASFSSSAGGGIALSACICFPALWKVQRGVDTPLCWYLRQKGSCFHFKKQGVRFGEMNEADTC